MRRLASLVLALAAPLTIAACGGDGQRGEGAGGRPSVVATTALLAEVAGRVGGNRVVVRSAVPPGADPHDFEPTPADLRSIQRAALVVRNGAGLEHWFDRTVEAAVAGAQLVDASTSVALRRGDDGSPDPHLWHDVSNIRAVAAAVAAGLREVDPEGAPTFDANLAGFDAELAQLDAEVRAAIGGLPDKRMVTSHDAFGYYAAAYGLEVVGSVIPSFETNAELSARGLEELVQRIRDTGVKAIFAESSLPPRTAEAIGRQAGVRVVAGDDALVADGLGPAGSPAATYAGMIRHNTTTIVEALR